MFVPNEWTLKWCYIEGEPVHLELSTLVIGINEISHQSIPNPLINRDKKCGEFTVDTYRNRQHIRLLILYLHCDSLYNTMMNCKIL